MVQLKLRFIWLRAAQFSAECALYSKKNLSATNSLLNWGQKGPIFGMMLKNTSAIYEGDLKLLNIFQNFVGYSQDSTSLLRRPYEICVLASLHNQTVLLEIGTKFVFHVGGWQLLKCLLSSPRDTCTAVDVHFHCFNNFVSQLLSFPLAFNITIEGTELSCAAGAKSGT